MKGFIFSLDVLSILSCHWQEHNIFPLCSLGPMILYCPEHFLFSITWHQLFNKDLSLVNSTSHIDVHQLMSACKILKPRDRPRSKQHQTTHFLAFSSKTRLSLVFLFTGLRLLTTCLVGSSSSENAMIALIKLNKNYLGRK